MDKLLSIIVPSYNMEAYLPKCLGSLIVDDPELLQKIDVIVVNDGSKDRTSEIAHDFERRYPGVFCVIDKPNGHYGSCINAALPAAKGKFVKVLDADDTYDSAVFEKYLRVLMTLPFDADMVVNDVVTVNESGEITQKVTYPLPEERPFRICEFSKHKIPRMMHAVCYRTELLREIHYTQIEGILYTDNEWVYLPVAASKSVYYCKYPVYRYLVGRTGQSVERGQKEKNLWMLEKIILRMVSQLEWRHYQPDECQCLEDHVRWMILHNYQLCSSSSSFKLLRRFFFFVHPIARLRPTLMSFLPDLGLFERMPFRFHYIRFLVEYPMLTVPVWSLVGIYVRIRSRTGQWLLCTRKVFGSAKRRT